MYSIDVKKKNGILRERQMVIETNRLLIQTASQEEMIRFIEKQTDDILIKAYREMLQGCLDHPDQWEWIRI